MKFSDFLNEEHLSPSIDDNDVISTLEDNGIFYDRVKDSNSNRLIYKFDNRYSIQYDGEIFTLYRHGNRIHMANARNRSEIEAAISKWNKSYSLTDIELTDDDIEDAINKMTDDSADDNRDDSSGDQDVKDKDEDDESINNDDEVNSDETDDKENQR